MHTFGRAPAALVPALGTDEARSQAAIDLTEGSPGGVALVLALSVLVSLVVNVGVRTTRSLHAAERAQGRTVDMVW